MPIYEYRCLACKRRTSVFVRSVSSAVRPKCEHCDSPRLARLMSRFAVRRGASAGGDDFGDLDGVDESDPRSVARWARRMAQESGEDLGSEFDDMVGRMEAGESPDDVMGGAGLGDDGGFDDDDDF